MGRCSLCSFFFSSVNSFTSIFFLTAPYSWKRDANSNFSPGRRPREGRSWSDQARGPGTFNSESWIRSPVWTPRARKESASLGLEIRPDCSRLGAKGGVGVKREFRKEERASVPEAHPPGGLPCSVWAERPPRNPGSQETNNPPALLCLQPNHLGLWLRQILYLGVFISCYCSMGRLFFKI